MVGELLREYSSIEASLTLNQKAHGKKWRLKFISNKYKNNKEGSLYRNKIFQNKHPDGNKPLK
jgi:hypothetical protein